VAHTHEAAAQTEVVHGGHDGQQPHQHDNRDQQRRQRLNVDPEASTDDALGGDRREELEINLVELLHQLVEAGGPADLIEAADGAEALAVLKHDLD
jgi:hypothetical protein